MKKIFLILLCYLFICPFSIYADELIKNSRSGILIEANSGKIIYEKNKDDKVSIASMTKMVAQIIILEEVEKGNIKWNDIVTVSRNASDMGGSQIYLAEGEKISVEDLMKGVSVASGNDATVALAEYISGTEDKFVDRMNAKVKELGLKNTHFVNCTGLDQDNHYSTSYDMAMIARDLVINHPEILRFSSIYEDYLRKDTPNKFWLVNTNKLINFYEGADGLKTGHTDNALYCLAATAIRNNLRLIAIVLGEKDSKIRNNETIELLDYGFNNISLRVLKKKNTMVKSIKLSKATSNNLNIYLKNDLFVIEDKIDRKKYNIKVEVNNIKLPIRKGEIVGKMVVYDNKKIVNSSALISLSNVEKLSFIELFKSNFIDLLCGKI